MTVPGHPSSRPIGIEFLTGLGLPPLDMIRLAGALGCRHLSMALGPNPINPEGHPPFDLVSDAGLRREIVAAMADHGVSISLGEGCVLTAANSARDIAAAQFDAMLALGVKRLGLVSMDPDVGRTFDQYGAFVEMAVGAGFEEVVCEFAPVLTLTDLATALACVRHVGRPDFRLLVDTMHLGSTGAVAADIAALDPALIGYVQLSDAPADIVLADYGRTAMTAREVVGDGALDIAAMISALPADRVHGIEVPQLARALAGEPVAAIVTSIVAATCAFLDRLDAAPPVRRN